MKKIGSREELEAVADDVQLVSDGAYGYFVALLSNRDVDEVIAAIQGLQFRKIEADLILSEVIEGSLHGWC